MNNRDLNLKHDSIWLLALLVVCIGVRLLPHPANISPLAALLLLASFEMRSKLFLIALPLLVGLVGDLFLKVDGSALFVTIGFVLNAFLGRGLLASKFNFPRLGAASFFSSLSFFLISNFGVWYAGFLYTRDLKGLVQCFNMALPFFQRSMLTDLGFSFGIFGLLIWTKRLRGVNVQALERSSSSED